MLSGSSMYMTQYDHIVNSCGFLFLHNCAPVPRYLTIQSQPKFGTVTPVSRNKSRWRDVMEEGTLYSFYTLYEFIHIKNKYLF